MKIGTFKILFVFCLISITITVRSQMVYDTLFLDEMVILSNYIDHNSSVKTQKIDTLSKQNLNNLNLGELLAANSPVFIKSYGKGSLATASFRGTAATHTKVLWNGFELNSPMLGQVDFSLIPNNFFNEVSLNYGGSSLECTSGALGGAIKLESSIHNQNKFSISQTVGSFNTYTTTVAANFKLGKFHSSTSVYLITSENSFAFYNNAIIPGEWQIQKNASFYNRGFVQEFEYQISDHQSIELKNWTQWDFREIPQIMVFRESDNHIETQSGFNSRSILSYKYHKSKSIFKIDGGWYYGDLNYYLKTNSAANNDDSVTYINSRNYSNTGFLKAGLRHNFIKGWSIKSDISFTKDVINSNNYVSVKTRKKYDLLLKISKDFNSRFIFDLIFRQQYADNKFTPTTPYLGFLIKPLSNSDLFFRISANMNYNLPSLNDLYWFPGGNINLLPEKGLQTDIGANYSKTISDKLNFEIDINYFRSRISNWIQWVPGDYRYWSARNIEVVSSRGIESSLRIYGVLYDVFYKVNAQYSFTRSTNESNKAEKGGYADQQIIYVPKHSANIFLHLNYKKFAFHWNTQFTGERNTTLDEPSQNSYPLPSYSVSNITIAKKITLKKYSLEFNFRLNNIFNTSYQTVLWRAMPGTNYEIGLSIKL